MHNIPEEAVKAAMCAWLHEEEYAYILEAWLEDEDRQNDMRAALTAALPFLSVKVAVKKLEWTKGVVDIASPHPGMKYVACNTTPKGSWAWWLDHAPETRAVFTSEEAAKAAAQADYEARILSALEPSAARSQALEEIIALCKDYAEDSQPDSEYRLACNDIIEAIQERRALSSPDHADAGKVEGDGLGPITDGLNAIGFEIGGGYVLKLSYDSLDQYEAARTAIRSAIPSAPTSEGAE